MVISLLSWSSRALGLRSRKRVWNLLNRGLGELTNPTVSSPTRKLGWLGEQYVILPRQTKPGWDFCLLLSSLPQPRPGAGRRCTKGRQDRSGVHCQVRKMGKPNSAPVCRPAHFRAGGKEPPPRRSSLGKWPPAPQQGRNRGPAYSRRRSPREIRAGGARSGTWHRLGLAGGSLPGERAPLPAPP